MKYMKLHQLCDYKNYDCIYLSFSFKLFFLFYDNHFGSNGLTIKSAVAVTEEAKIIYYSMYIALRFIFS